MKFYKIGIEPVDSITDAYIRTLRGYYLGDGRYILDSDKEGEYIKEILAETAENVEVVEIAELEFESFCREKKNFPAQRPKIT